MLRIVADEVSQINKIISLAVTHGLAELSCSFTQVGQFRECFRTERFAQCFKKAVQLILDISGPGQIHAGKRQGCFLVGSLVRRLAGRDERIHDPLSGLFAVTVFFNSRKEIIRPADTGFCLLGGDHIVRIGSDQMRCLDGRHEAGVKADPGQLLLCEGTFLQCSGEFLHREIVLGPGSVPAQSAHRTASMVPHDQCIFICRKVLMAVIQKCLQRRLLAHVGRRIFILR